MNTSNIKNSDVCPDGQVYGRAKAIRDYVNDLAPFLVAVLTWTNAHQQTLGIKTDQILVVHTRLKPRPGDVVLFEHDHRNLRLIGLFTGREIRRTETQAFPKKEAKILGVVVPRRPLPPARVA